jgi:tRNA C32,U32 (ribose-2'-O)-methylase TrmJ
MEPFMIRCRNVAELLTSDRLRDCSFATKLQVRMHLWMCRYCARLARQVEQMRAAASKLAAVIGREKTGAAGEDLESRLLRKLSRTDG